ncbi:hypothetical protein [Mariniblastus fucicola]|uniref:Uncharacterized protein n=1 Tax=Mariniblastus fucicola TaxID=980251 RepID=A0A5B9P9U1_9BACT|nr:hypothetical protein [Mariniblastus fucicola]QEG23098.1 hypothetical protein MFFC18_29930 [Mariniblastus fucicola]
MNNEYDYSTKSFALNNVDADTNFESASGAKLIGTGGLATDRSGVTNAQRVFRI